MPANPKIQAMEAIAKGIKYERICLSCWMNIINQWLLKPLVMDCRDSFFSYFICFGFVSILAWLSICRRVVMFILFYFFFQLSTFNFNFNESFFCCQLRPICCRRSCLRQGQDSHQLRCISRDCKCDDIGEKQMMADLARESEV